MSFFKVAGLIAIVNAQLKFPYPQPKYPPTDQQSRIPAASFAEPLIAETIAYVKSKVNPELWNLPKSIQTSPTNANSQVAYPNDAAKYCYHVVSQCYRQADTPDFKADLFKCPNSNDWGLTYDDGPSIDPANVAGTPQLLDALDAAKIKATFFVTGTATISTPRNTLVLGDSYKRGHEIALHSFSHHPLTSCTSEEIVAELKFNEAIIYKATGVIPIHFRPPYGDIDDRVRAIATAMGYRVVLWTTNPDRVSEDTSVAARAAAIAAKVTTLSSATVTGWFAAQPGFVSLQHDITPTTVSIGLGMLKAITALGAGFTLKPQPVGQCLGLPSTQWYQFSNVTSPTATGIAAPTSITKPALANGIKFSCSIFTILFVVLLF